MKRRIIAIMLAVSALFSMCAFAETQAMPLASFTGDLDWPEFNGMNLGVSMQYVLLYEERYNGAQPVLSYPIGMTMQEIESSDEYDTLVWNIGEKEIYGQACSVEYTFADNVLEKVECTARFADRDSALAFAQQACDAFVQNYGAGTDSLSINQQMGEDVLLAKDWRKRSSQLPGMLNYEIDGQTYQEFPREYCWPSASVYCTAEDDASFCVIMNVSMSYVWSAAELYEEKAQLNGKSMEEWLEQHEGAMDYSYHDSRYTFVK